MSEHDKHKKPDWIIRETEASAEYISAIIERQKDLVRTVIAVLKHDDDLRREFLAALGYQVVDTPMVYQDADGKRYMLSYLSKVESESE